MIRLLTHLTAHECFYMNLSALNSISPVDGRYLKKTRALSPFFSEFGLIYYRLVIEIRWLESLADNPKISEVPSFNRSL